jgi:hypothetical protein
MSKGAMVTADASELFKLGVALKNMDKPIQRAIRSTLTKETKKVVQAVRQEVLSIPVKGGGEVAGGVTSAFKPARRSRIKGVAVEGPMAKHPEINVRQAIAKGVRSSIRYGSEKRGASIAIVGSANHLPDEKKVLNKLLNRKSFRHPVFARGSVRSLDEFGQKVRKAGGREVIRFGSNHGIFQGKHGKQIGVTSWRWVEQAGHPFFGKTTSKFRQPVHDALVKAVNQAIEEELSHVKRG